jgi:hypothetical protein
MTNWFTCALALVCTTASAMQITTSSTVSTSLYGVPWNADGLSNTPIGRSPNRMADYRFRAAHSGTITSIRIYLGFDKVSTNCIYNGYYAGGTGGKILIQLRSDDGSSDHRPTSSVLASHVITDPLACNAGVSSCTNSQRQFFFDEPASGIAAGTIYHLVFTNADSDPACNWTSIENLYNDVDTPSIQPAVSDTDFAELVKDVGDWQVSYDDTPILSVYYSDGTEDGQGFIWDGPGYNIEGNHSVRETFTPSGSSFDFSHVFVRLQVAGSPRPLTVQVETDSGMLIDSGTVGASSIDANGWAAVTFNSSHTLEAGQSYHLVLSAPSDSSSYYISEPLQAGSAYGFHPPNIFPDGYFEYSDDGSSWTGYAGWRTDFDLQFYFSP